MAPVDWHADHLIELEDHQGICKVTRMEGNAHKKGKTVSYYDCPTEGYVSLNTQESSKANKRQGFHFTSNFQPKDLSDFFMFTRRVYTCTHAHIQRGMIKTIGSTILL